MTAQPSTAYMIASIIFGEILFLTSLFSIVYAARNLGKINSVDFFVIAFTGIVMFLASLKYVCDAWTKFGTQTGYNTTYYVTLVIVVLLIIFIPLYIKK